MTISKKQLIAVVANETGDRKSDVETTLDALLGEIERALSAGADVRIAGFGTFSLKKTPARVGRNPSTGLPLAISEKSKPVFKPASDFVAKFN